MGTIFGIYKRREGSKGDLKDVLRPGKEMVAAGYTMYGSSCNVSRSIRPGDLSIGTRLRSQADMMMLRCFAMEFRSWSSPQVKA